MMEELFDVQEDRAIGTDVILEQFLSEYKLTGVPIEVSFRALLPELNKIDRFSHLIHTYPAKLLMHIPHFFLNNTIFSKPGDTVLDPFCGTGTVLLEAMAAGRRAFGADANPLARLIAKVKTTGYSVTALKKELANILANFECATIDCQVNVVNVDYWFSNRVQKELQQILTLINLIGDQLIREFFLISFSNLVKKVSYADPRVAVPVKLNKNRFKVSSVSYNKVEKRLSDLESINVKEKFHSICNENIERVSNKEDFLKANNCSATAQIIATDARNITSSLEHSSPLPDNSVNLILTSPPYAGAQKYIRSSSLNLGWLGLASVNELKHLDDKSIGRENIRKSELSLRKTGIHQCDCLIEEIREINAVRAEIVTDYMIQMQCALDESLRVLKPGGFMILVVGNNMVCNREFNTQQYLTDYLLSQGLNLTLKMIDHIKSYGLMTKRNKTADIISREWILIFQK